MTRRLAQGLLTVAGLAASFLTPHEASAGTTYVHAGLVIPIEGDPIPDGRIVIRDGKITDVGADVERPPFSDLVDARGQTVTPGFIVPVTRLGLPPLPRAPERAPDQAKVAKAAATQASADHRPRHAVHPRLLVHGITTLGLVPSARSAGVHGQAAAVTTGGEDGASSVLSARAGLVVDVASHGTWRTEIGKLFRDAVEKVEEERRKAARGGGNGGGRRGRQGNGDPVQAAVKGELPVLLSPRTAAGWVASRDTLPLDRLDTVVLDAGELWRLAEEFADAEVRVVTWPTLTRLTRTRHALNRAAEYEAAGVRYAFRLPTDSVEGAASLRDQAIEMARTGCSRAAVLAALTREPAAVLGLEDEVGSIQSGRRADLLFWSGDPLDPTTRLEQVMVAGERVERPASASGDGA